MYEKFLRNGISFFSEHEKLEIFMYEMISRKNTNEIAHMLINKFKSLDNVFAADPDKLQEIEGVGPAVSKKLSEAGKEILALRKEKPNKVRLNRLNIIFDYCLNNLSKNEYSCYIITLTERMYVFQLHGTNYSIRKYHDYLNFLSSQEKMNGCKKIIIVWKVNADNTALVNLATKSCTIARRFSKALNKTGVDLQECILMNDTTCLTLLDDLLYIRKKRKMYI